MDEPLSARNTAPEDAFDRSRRILGDAGQDRLARATVMVLGCGGVGSNCIEALARGGIGHLIIVDKDVVAPSNINRQAIAFESTVGRRKIEVTRALIADINPACTVTAIDRFVLEENLGELFAQALAASQGRIDYVVDAIDTISTKLAIAHYAEHNNLMLISSMGGANKLHPECLRVTDIHKTVNCRLARIMRKECRRRGIRHLRVLYSCEDAAPATALPGTERSERSGMGTVSYMPPIMGQMIAGEVIRHIAHIGENDDLSAALAMHDAAQRGTLAGRRKEQKG